MIQKTCDPWDARMFALCILVASWSEDRGRKIGSVVVGPAKEIRATGYNGLPRGVDAFNEERHSRVDGKKYLCFEHAERNAIYNATRSATSLVGCRIYITAFPCADCARAIIQTGIVEVNTFPHKEDDAVFVHHYPVATAMLQEAGVAINLYSPNDALLKEASCAFNDLGEAYCSMQL